MKNTIDVHSIVSPEDIARDVANRWTTWNGLRVAWLEEKKELRNYVYATDTRTTGNKKLPWANSTTTPKLTQIYDNLKANYSYALFPNTNWMRWEGDDKNSSLTDKRRGIQEYMKNKLSKGGFELAADKLVDDYILFGNCFGTVEYATEYNEYNGEQVAGFIGPRVVRISPYDICFDPTAASFEHTPKIIRSLVGLGDLQKMIDKGENKYNEVFKKILDNRQLVGSSSQTEKSEGFVADGFSNIEAYYSSGYVEILTFYGDLFDPNTRELKLNRKIEIVDRAYVVSDEPIPSWLGKAPIFHASWRSRPDNLYGMGPLDNLVGMQYRIDHLENLKADVFDQIALPILKIRGDVEEFKYEPGARIYLGEEGDVAPMSPDTTVLQADLQINLLENKMEEMAGAPRQAMGIRTPGEKTAFEVQTLSDSASRIFQHKAAKLEKEFIEPLLNSMLESARRNMDTQDVIRVLDDKTGADLFLKMTKEDIVANGILKPIGARHFAERAQRVQNLSQLMQVKADPTVGVHISGKEIARLITWELGEDKLFGPNISIKEQAETAMMAQDTEADMQEEMQVAAEQGF